MIKSFIQSKAKGFTLIELLVVIAIIGILAGIVLASLSTARGGAGDAKSKEQLSNLRTAMEVYYSSNGNYGPSATSDGCSTAPSAVPWNTSGVSALADEDNYTGTTFVCYASGGATNADTWAAQITLSNGTDRFCVDSAGTARQGTNLLAAPGAVGTDSVCP